MSGTIVSTTTCIMETTMAFSIEMLTSRKLRQDRPRGLAESEALENFKSEVQGWYFSEGTAEDYFLLRFLRARGLNIHKAKEMLRKYMEYRKTNQYLSDLSMKSYRIPEYVLEQVPFVRSGNDFDGRPVFVIQMGHANLKQMFDNGGKEDLLRLGHFALEFLVYASEKQRKKYGCTKVVGIADFEGFSFRNAFHTQTVQSALYAARIFEAYYPELLHLAIGINANWIFNSLYNMMKPFVSQETIEKVQVFGYDASKWKPVLRKYIPEDAIPVEYGGTGRALEYPTCSTFEGFHVQRW